MSNKPTTAKDSTTQVLDFSRSVLKKEQARRNLQKAYLSEEMIPVIISPFYAKYLGKTAMLSLQGIPCYVPADGGSHRIPASFAALLHQTIRAIDDRERRIQSMSNVSENLEKSPGALHF